MNGKVNANAESCRAGSGASRDVVALGGRCVALVVVPGLAVSCPNKHGAPGTGQIAMLARALTTSACSVALLPCGVVFAAWQDGTFFCSSRAGLEVESWLAATTK